MNLVINLIFLLAQFNIILMCRKGYTSQEIRIEGFMMIIIVHRI